MLNQSVSISIEPQPSSNRASPVLTPQQFHEAIGGVIGQNRIYDLLRSGQLRSLKIGRRYYILRSEVDDFFQRESVLAEAGSWAA